MEKDGTENNARRAKRANGRVSHADRSQRTRSDGKANGFIPLRADGTHREGRDSSERFRLAVGGIIAHSIALIEDELRECRQSAIAINERIDRLTERLNQLRELRDDFRDSPDP